jgi:antitoxin CptB
MSEAAPAAGRAGEEARLRRLRIRSWRRGMRETDLILGRFADRALAGLAPAELDAFEALLEESDRDILGWVTGEAAVPAAHAPILARIAAALQP